MSVHTPAELTLLPPVRGERHRVQTFLDLTEWFSPLFTHISSQLRRGFGLSVFSLFQWLTVCPRWAVSLGRGFERWMISPPARLGSILFQALDYVRQDQSEPLQSITSVRDPFDSNNATKGQVQWGSKIQSTEFMK